MIDTVYTDLEETVTKEQAFETTAKTYDPPNLAYDEVKPEGDFKIFFDK